MMRFKTLARFALVTALVAASVPVTGQQQAAPILEISELWQEPVDLLERDLFAGPAAASLAPATDTPFQFVAFKTSGVNPGYDVRDASGRLWSVKLGVEAQSEVTASRLLWAIGYHQPAVYFVPQWTLTGQDAGVKGQSRFRTDLDQWKVADEWSWYENPFINSQPFRGLVAAQMLLNSWDLKTSNNRIYEAVDQTARPRRFFIVRDLGSSLGTSKQARFFNMLGTRGSQGSKNDIEGFERQGFIKEVKGNTVEFDYRGLNDNLVDLVTVPDVIWICEQFAKLPDGHWDAAFRAGGYPPDVAERYIRKLKEKVAEGLALRATSTR